MDIFSDDAVASDSTTPSWLLAATATAAPSSTPSGDLAKLPPEVVAGLLSWLPSSTLAAVCAVSRWLNDATRAGAVEAVQRHGVRMPARRLGEGWPCVVKRAELRAASREQLRISAGFASGAWLAPDGTPRIVQLHHDRSSRVRSYLPWVPQPALPRAVARAVACGSAHVLVLLDDSRVVLLDTPPPTADMMPGADSSWRCAASGRAGRPCEWRVLDIPAAAADSPAACAPLHASPASGSSARPHLPPPPRERAVGVAAGAFHSLIVGDRGSLWACGFDAFGQLGLGVRDEPSGRLSADLGLYLEGVRGGVYREPVCVPMHKRALQPSGGGYHSLVLTHSGAVLSFGQNGSGQLGLGDQVNRCTPTAVPLPGGEVACAVSAGGDHSLVLTERGEVFGFGSCAYGALGRLPTVEVQKLPERVPLGVRVRQIAAGYDHALAVTSDGRVLSWGSAGDVPIHVSSTAPLDEGSTAPGSPPRLESESDESVDDSRSTTRRPSPNARDAIVVGQLGRWVEPTDGHNGDEWEMPLLYSSTPAVASALGPCELVAAGSFCSMGLARRAATAEFGDAFRMSPKLAPGMAEERGVHVLSAGDEVATVRIAGSWPPRELEDVAEDEAVAVD